MELDKVLLLKRKDNVEKISKFILLNKNLLKKRQRDK